MTSLINPTALGKRIAIIGPSGSGKSTLATRLGAALHAPVVHLDQLAHYPNTQWQPRPQNAFIALHDIELEADSWIIEGNYSVTMPQRFARATALIWLDFDRWGCLWRYTCRAFQPASKRHGTLPGAVERFNWQMVRYIVFIQPPKSARYQDMIDRLSIPVIRMKSMRSLKTLYEQWLL